MSRKLGTLGKMSGPTGVREETRVPLVALVLFGK
jgi:hypothetical protein